MRAVDFSLIKVIGRGAFGEVQLVGGPAPAARRTGAAGCCIGTVLSGEEQKVVRLRFPVNIAPSPNGRYARQQMMVLRLLNVIGEYLFTYLCHAYVDVCGEL